MSNRATANVEMRVQGEVYNITPFVEQFVWTESMLAGGFSWSLRFRADVWKEWDNLLMGRENSEYAFRVVSAEVDSLPSTEWRTVIVDKSRVAFAQDLSMLAEVKGADQRLLMSQKARTRAWNNLRASDVMQQIAGEYGLATDIETSANIDTWVQARQDDWSFLRSVAHRATVQSNRGDSYLWMDGSTLRYRAPSMTDVSERRYDVATVEQRVESFTVTYNGREVDRAGGAALRAVGFDFDTKQGVVFDMDASAAAVQPALASRVPRRMDGGLRVIPIADEELSVVGEHGRAWWGAAAPRYLSLALETRPDPTLRPNTIIAIENNLGDDQQTPFMGRYAVLEVQHVCARGGSLTTKLTAFRREAQTGDAQPTGATANNIGTRDRNQRAGLDGTTTRVAKVI